MPTDPADITDLRRRIGSHWRDLARKRGGPAAVARSLGISQQMLEQWLNGSRMPRPDLWPKLATAFGVTTCDDFFPAGILRPDPAEEKSSETERGGLKS